MGYLGDNLSEDEKFNELNERLSVLDAFLLTEKAAPYKLFGSRCQMVLKLQVDKLKGVIEPYDKPSENSNADEATPITAVPVQTPDVTTSPEPTSVPTSTPTTVPVDPNPVSTP